MSGTNQTAMDDAAAQDILSRLLADARRAGADAADAMIYNSVSHGVSWRMGKLEDVERSESLDLGLRILVGRRQATVATTDLRAEGLAGLVDRCAAMAKAAPEDPYAGLAPSERLAQAPLPELDLGDFAEPDAGELKLRAAECEDAARAVQGVTNSSGAGASYTEGRKWFATTAGFFGSSGGCNHSVSVSVIAADANGMERDYDYDSRTHWQDMRTPADIGAVAGRRTVERLSPRKVQSRPAPVIFDNRLSKSLLGHLAGAINGASIARGVSFLKNKKGVQIFPRDVTIIDDPHLQRMPGSRPFDGEGVAAQRIKIVDQGVLTDWLMNSAHARQLNLQTNGRATRGVSGPPGAGSTNMWLEAGALGFDQLLREAGEGLLVTDMFGPQVNSNTGDYSVGCAGFWVTGGARAYPVAEITIAGNLLDMFQDIVPADDLEFHGSTNAPSVLIGGMTIAGS